jgi:hypothetical protein
LASSKQTCYPTQKVANAFSDSTQEIHESASGTLFLHRGSNQGLTLLCFSSRCRRLLLLASRHCLLASRHCLQTSRYCCLTLLTPFYSTSMYSYFMTAPPHNVSYIILGTFYLTFVQYTC